MSAKVAFKLRPLGELCEVTGGNSAPQGEEYFHGGTIPFVRMRDLGGYHHTTCLDTTRDAVTHSAVEKMRLKIFEPGCILFPRSGSVQLNHRAILAIRACIVSHIGILKQFSEDIEVRYLYWFLVRYDMGVIAKQTTGLDLVGFSDVKKISVPVPTTRTEQRRIVAEIEKQFTRLEAGLTALRRVQANLKRYRAAILKAACEGKLVPTEAELAKTEKRTYESGDELLSRILTERRKNWQGRGKYKEPASLETTNLSALPGNWAWATVEQLGRIETGSTPPKAEAANYGDEVPLVKPGELLDHPVAAAADNLTRKGASVATTTPANSVLVSCIGNLGKTALTVCEVAFNQQINAIIPTLTTTARWIFYTVQHGAFRQQLESVASATTISIVNKSKFSALIVPLPPLAEQTRIVAEVERRLSVVEELEAVVSANLQRAVRLRQSILQKAFTGKL